MPLIPNTGASNPQPPIIPIGTTDSSWRNEHNPDRPMGEPIINFPYAVVKNVMFFVERIVKNPNELSAELGTPYNPTAGTTFLPFMREAVLVHVEPVAEDTRRHIYRFYYMVPPQEQYRYNIQDMKKIQDGYTLKDTAADGNFMSSAADAEDLKDFYEIIREWVEPTDSAYTPLALGSFDPSNEKLDPDFYDLHDYTAYDAQLVYEEVGRFEQEHLNKYFRKVTRVYKTLPGPVVKEFMPNNMWVKGDTVWENGGPGTSVPENEWVSQNAIKLSREVWAAPLWEGEGGAEPGQARIPFMPTKEFEGKPLSTGWDKGTYPSLQNYTVVTMFKRNSSIVENEQQNSLSGNCCNPDSRFVRCINTTVTTSQSVDWTANGDLPSIEPPEPGENCSQWRVDSSVVVREGYSQKETRKQCTTYEQIDEFWESQFDRITNQVYPVLRKIVHEPSTEFDKDWQEEGFKKYTDSVGNVYYGRKLESPVTEVSISIPDTVWVKENYSLSDFSVGEDNPSPTGLLANLNVINGWNDPSYPSFSNYFAFTCEFTSNNPGRDRGTVVTVYYKNKRWWPMYVQNSMPVEQSPGTISTANHYYNVNPDGPWYTADGLYRISMEGIISDTLYGEGVSGQTWTLPIGYMDGSGIYKRGTYNPEMKFTVGSLPTGISKVFLDVTNGQLNMLVWVENPNGIAINGNIPIKLNGTKIFDIAVTSSVSSSNEPPSVVTRNGEKSEYTDGTYSLKAAVANRIELSYNGTRYPYFQFGATVATLTGNTFKLQKNTNVSRVVLRQWVNPCYAVDSYMQIPGIGYYRKYTTTMNYSFPAVLGNVSWMAWNTRPDMSGKQGGQYFPSTNMKRDSYSGPCRAVVEELFSPDGSWPSTWGLGTSPQFTTASGYFSTPLVDFRLPACLHTQLNFTVTIGNQDAKWTPGFFNATFPATSVTDWTSVTSYYASPWNGGMLCKKVTIYPPTA
nr:MAG TPA: hypothetical protein [Caudoviricetes sp.]